MTTRACPHCHVWPDLGAPNHAADCPEQTGVWPSSTRYPYGLMCADCSDMDGPFTTVPGEITFGVPTDLVVCLGCAAHRTVIGVA